MLLGGFVSFGGSLRKVIVNVDHVLKVYTNDKSPNVLCDLSNGTTIEFKVTGDKDVALANFFDAYESDAKTFDFGRARRVV